MTTIEKILTNIITCSDSMSWISDEEIDFKNRF